LSLAEFVKVNLAYPHLIMAIIEPLRQDVQHPQQVKKNSFNLRLWHWLNFLVISGSLLTVLINSTLLDRGVVTEAIGKQLKSNGSTNVAADAGKIAHDLGDQVWQVHIYIGIALAVLLLYRIVLEFFQPGNQHFFKKIRVAINRYQDNSSEKRLARHEVVVKALYLIFYLLLAIIAVTGLSLAFKKNFGISKPLGHQIKEIHGFCMYLIIAFILVHLAGVLLAERKDSKGIISDMFNGGSESI
jgi:Ni/Fe-hydrogenase 1 B-type cytochrome subunit